MKRDIRTEKRSKIKATAPEADGVISVLFIIGMTAGCTVKIVWNSGRQMSLHGKTVTGAKQEDAAFQRKSLTAALDARTACWERGRRVMARIV